MSAVTVRFLPERFRPRAPRPRARWRLLPLIAVPLIAGIGPLWRVRAVDVNPCPELPQCAQIALAEAVGSSLLTLDLERLRDQVGVWPVISSVDIRLRLPDTLEVRVEPARPCGSIRVASGWRGVAEDGTLTGLLDSPLLPVLDRLDRHPHEHAEALAIARRLEGCSGVTVTAVSRTTPADLRIDLSVGGQPAVVHVTPRPTLAEERWCRLVDDGVVPGWADLRSNDVLIVGGDR
jgi:hypothetical protein